MSAHLARTDPDTSNFATGGDWRVQPLAWQDERQAAAMLVRAFAEDPLVRAICGQPESRREEKMLWSFRLSLRAHCLSPHPGWVARSGNGNIAGLVLVSYPGARLEARPDTWFSLRSLWHIGWASAQRGAEAARTIGRHLPLQPFVYVRTLGVDPAFQRRGLGSALLEYGIRCVRRKLPAYLETAREENVRFYAQHGFRCVGTFRCLEVPVWRMWRPAEST
jgi:GNAT superfamily N-acetyltransferase